MKQSNTYHSDLSFALLLVGEPKSGKTRVAASFPRPYFLDFDRNLGSLIANNPTVSFLYDNPYEDDSGKPIEPKDLWEVNINRRLKAAVASPDVDTIVLDSLSTLSDTAIQHIIGEVRRQEGKVIEVPRIQDYTTFRNLFVRLITYLRKSSKNIIFTSHQKTNKDELTGILRYQLSMPGQLADNFGGFFSDIWACEAKPGARGPTYHVHTAPAFRHVELGHSFKVENSYDVTDKTEPQIWSLFSPTFVGRTVPENKTNNQSKN